MSTKKAFKILTKSFIIALCLSLSFPSPTQALEVLRSFHVKQIRESKNGVLVSKPHPLDLKIIDIIDLNNIRSLEDYARWLNKNVRYQSDAQGDIWTRPSETLLKKNGDCEDYAFLNAYVLKILGYQPRFIALKGPKGAHAICLFKSKGYYLWFDNAKLVRTKTTNLREFSQHVTQTYKYSHVFELNLQSRQWNLLYQS